MASSNLTMTLIVVLAIDIMLFLAQASTTYINQEFALHEENIDFYDYNNSYMRIAKNYQKQKLVR
jgi:hypothetical protein